MVNHCYLTFQRFNPAISQSCRIVMQRQAWSKQGRNLPLCLFSSYLSCDDKASVAARICTIPRIEVMPGHPAMPELKSDFHLADYVTAESWVLFDLIGRGVDWLKEDPNTWDQDEQYVATKDIVDHLCGVNDPAERVCGTAKLFKVMI